MLISKRKAEKKVREMAAQEGFSPTLIALEIEGAVTSQSMEAGNSNSPLEPQEGI